MGIETGWGVTTIGAAVGREDAYPVMVIETKEYELCLNTGWRREDAYPVMGIETFPPRFVPVPFGEA